ncbi:MAG TPA: hypothetical protein VLG37_03235 [Candidatus Saccharimonadales bacterium]|nr:hypothetical protein [Candidatus Saccharimonadales bacterium]
METKTYIWIGIFVGSTIGGILGGFLDHGNFLGLWGFVLGTVGAFLGIWVGYRLGNG